MDEEPSGGADGDAAKRPPPASVGTAGDQIADGGDLSLTQDAPDGAEVEAVEEASPAAEIIGLEWDDDLPVALGEETDQTGTGDTGDTGDDEPSAADPQGDAAEDADADDEEWDDDPLAPSRVARRNALPRRVESWRSRSASGAIATAIAMGLQQVFEPEKKRPAAVAEAPSDPYSKDDPITVDYVPDDAEATTVHVKPWLLQKGDPA